ncbi:MAG: TIGR03936 family radical SAM-associated protein [Clostridiales bacterium]|nr:TIGR03936 family radical SAM-associated protein [Clostridiales bacterium]
MKCARLWYKKSGMAIYTSHLDMNRCFSKAVTRADIPLWYTEGFNPHPYMTFLAPLALGQSAKREPIDIKLEDDEITFDRVKSRLNAVLPEGLEIVDVTEGRMKPGEIAKAKYKIRCFFICEADAVSFRKNALNVLNSGEMFAEKRSKRGVKTVNLCPMVSKCVITAVDSLAVVEAVLSAGNNENLNPQLFIETLAQYSESEFDDIDIIRQSLLTESGELFE